MQTFNWFFGLDEKPEHKEPTESAVSNLGAAETQEKISKQTTDTASSVRKEESSPRGSSADLASEPVSPSVKHQAQTGVFSAPSVGGEHKAQAQPKPPSPAQQAAPIKKAAPATQVAYVPTSAPALSIASKAALADAQAKLKGAIPVSLQPQGAIRSSPKSKADIDTRRRRLQTGLLAGTTVAVMGAVVWSFLPAPVPPPLVVTKQVASQAPIPTTSTAPSEPTERESLSSRCVKDATEYTSSVIRDQLLLDAIIAFEKGRLEQAQSLFEKYSSISCDNATLEATAVLQRQLGARSPER